MANKNPLEIIKRPVAYASGYENIPTKAQDRAKQLCWEYNRTAPNEKNRRRAILQELLGTCSEMTGIEPDFHCDYGFNIHMHGLVIINCNCVILDTSPVNIGTGTFIATGVPCKVIRPITEKDKIAPEGFYFEHTDFVFVSMN